MENYRKVGNRRTTMVFFSSGILEMSNKIIFQQILEFYATQCFHNNAFQNAVGIKFHLSLKI